MRTAVLSDVHGNLPALQAVSRDANMPPAVDEYWYLGDAVGYGPWPLGVWEVLRDLNIPDGCWLAGNHEWGLLRKLPGRRLISIGGQVHSLGFYSRLAWPILKLQQEVLQDQERMREHLDSLPVHGTLGEGIHLAHGTFAFEGSEEDWVIRYSEHPTLRESDLRRLEEQSGSRPRLFAAGHTHKQAIWCYSADVDRWDDQTLRREVEMGDLLERPIFLNPGSVGFPRDGDGCACYAIVDWTEGQVELRRVWYDQQEIWSVMNGTLEYRNLLTEGFLPACQSLNGGG